MKILFSTPSPRSTDNPYLRQLVAGLQEHAEVSFLDVRSALVGRPDVFHVHWPHQLYSADGAAKTVIKYLLTSVLLIRLRARRTPVVLTVHNLASHESDGFWGRRMLRRLDRLITRRIYLNEASTNDLDAGVVILHGDYRAWLSAEGIDLHAPMPSTPQIALFGMLRPYKGIESLISAAAEAALPLRIAGRALDPEYGRTLASLAPIELRHLSDTELAELVHGASLIALPYQQMYNSGALLYALSLGRPVLAPHSAANDAIAAEIGGDWLILYDGELATSVLSDAARRMPTGAPDLRRRSWPESIERHFALYRELTGQIL